MADNHGTKRTEQQVLNSALEESFDPPAIRTTMQDFDGSNLTRSISRLVAKKITVSGDDTYVAVAPIGTAQATAGWQAKKINVTGGDTVVTWADGNASFDNVATDLTALTYS